MAFCVEMLVWNVEKCVESVENFWFFPYLFAIINII